MRIPLTFADDQVQLTCRMTTPRTSASVTFIVDTGSPYTFLGGSDTRRQMLRVSYANKPQTIYWGDTAFKLGNIQNVSLWVRKEENGEEGLEILRLPRMHATRDWVLSEAKDGVKGYVSPSIIGVNFLVDHKLRLVVDGLARSAYLEQI